MTEQQIRKLLAVAMAYDNRRTPGQANIAAWQEQAIRHRWDFDEAVEAIHAHYGESAEFLTPAHITARIRAARRLPPAPVDIPALHAAQPADLTRIREVVTELADHLGWRPRRIDPALDVECPYCHACPGRPCATQITRGPRRGQYQRLSNAHPSRQDAAQSAAGGT